MGPKNRINIDSLTFEVFEQSILVLNHSRIAQGRSAKGYAGFILQIPEFPAAHANPNTATRRAVGSGEMEQAKAKRKTKNQGHHK